MHRGTGLVKLSGRSGGEEAAVGRDVNCPAPWSGAERCVLGAALAQKRGDGP